MSLRTRVAAAALALGQVLVGPANVAHEEPATPTEGGLRPLQVDDRRPRITPLPVTQSRWLQADIETALLTVSTGDMALVGQLARTFVRDGFVQGLLGTRSGGLIRLPRRFSGTARAVALVQGDEGGQGLFARIFPPAELQRLHTDGITCGVGVAMFVQRACDEFPYLMRLDPQFLIYRQSEDRWYYRTIHGLEPVVPGDGRWVLHTPAGRVEPWNHGLWQAIGRSYISKEHAFLHRENFGGKIANPARVATAPQGASEEQKQGWFQRVMAWGVNTVFGMTPGYDVKLLESNGRGHEIFEGTIKSANEEFIVSICGQMVTVTGGAGFANANIHATIRTDIIQGDGDALAFTLNTQALPFVVFDFVGEGERCMVAWDTRPPADLKAGAESLTASAKAITDLTAALEPHGMQPDVAAICAQFAVPTQPIASVEAANDGSPSPSAELAAAMTEHGMTRCEHGRTNRCWLCGVERARGIVTDENGERTYSLGWRAIAPTVSKVAA